MADFDVTVIGAGVIGLAVAYEIANKYKTLLLEKNRSFGLETSSHNSGVIHSGINYVTGSNKAQLCVEGNRLLYELAEMYGIPYKRTGKLVVAVEDSEKSKLEELLRQGENNGVEGLRIISGADVKKIEPYINAVEALYCPSTGIIDQMALMKFFESRARNDGTTFAYNTKVIGIEKVREGCQITTEDGSSATTRCLVNCAGLFADKVAQMAGIDIDAAGYRQRFNKGSYYAVTDPKKRKMVKRLIYSVPLEDGNGLGIHITIDLNGQMLLGPDSEIVNEGSLNYINDGLRAAIFHQEVQRYFPQLDISDIAKDMVGYRPQLIVGRERFIINEESSRGLPGMINLIGIESPGLTSSPAIAKHIKSILDNII